MLIAGFLLINGLSAYQSTNSPNGPTTDTKQSAQAATGAGDKGGAIYKANCISCHGDKLEGTLGPNLQQVGSRLSKEQIAAKVQNGGGSMPAFKSKLKDADVESLAEWLSIKK
ncbi:hypothetical protein BK127_38900 [Paenibacillus sp. FSL H7-0331]|nr:hypothetical protein BK127_38900 [Paenibacillus sp. FSL H7-0331]